MPPTRWYYFDNVFWVKRQQQFISVWCIVLYYLLEIFNTIIFGVSPSPYMTDGVVVLIPPGHPSVGCVETSTLSRGSWWFIWAMWQLAWWSICGNPQREGWGHLMGWGIAQGLNSNILWQDFFWTHPTSFFAFGFFCSKLPLDKHIPLKKIAFILICSHTHFPPGFPEGRQCCVLAT